MTADNVTQSIFYPYTVHYKKVLYHSVEIAYCDEGKGDKTILFIHGLGHALIGWQKNIEVLKQHYRCIAIDLPGNGLSSKSNDYPYGMHFFAQCIRDLIEQLKLKNVFLCGHSMGGQIAFTLAEENLPQIKGLIQCAPAGIETFNDWEKSLYQNTMMFVDMVSTEENSLKKAIHNSFYILPESAHLFIQQLIDLMKMQQKPHYRIMIDRCIKGMLNEPVTHLFDRIKVPILILFGEKDALIPNRFIHRITVKQLLEKTILNFRDASYVIIPRCGHFLQWEKPSDVNHYIDGFLKEH